MTEGPLDIARLGVSYRGLVLWFGAQLVVVFVAGIAALLGSPLGLLELIRIGRFFALLVTICALVLYAYRTAGALGSRVPALWAIAMLVPLVNVLTLLILSARATKSCRKAGIPVGFFGPRMSAVPETSVGGPAT